MFQDTRTITNKSDGPLTVWLEPWAQDYALAPGQKLEVIGSSTQDGCFEVSDHGNKVGIYCWAGSSVKVFRDGILEDDWPVCFDKPMPSGGSLKDFIEGFFGGPGEPGGRVRPHQT